MKALDPINFCPAAACSAELARLETLIEITTQLMDHAARSPGCLPLMRGLEAISEDLTLSAEDARDRLAKVEPISAAGAMAQLLAAIRDVRVRDDAESERAKDLEAQAVRFLGEARLFGAQFCGVLSHTRLGRRLVSPARKIAQTGV